MADQWQDPHEFDRAMGVIVPRDYEYGDEDAIGYEPPVPRALGWWKALFTRTASENAGAAMALEATLDCSFEGRPFTWLRAPDAHKEYHRWT